MGSRFDIPSINIINSITWKTIDVTVSSNCENKVSTLQFFLVKSASVTAVDGFKRTAWFTNANLKGRYPVHDTHVWWWCWAVSGLGEGWGYPDTLARWGFLHFDGWKSWWNADGRHATPAPTTLRYVQNHVWLFCCFFFARSQGYSKSARLLLSPPRWFSTPAWFVPPSTLLFGESWSRVWDSKCYHPRVDRIWMNTRYRFGGISEYQSSLWPIACSLDYVTLFRVAQLPSRELSLFGSVTELPYGELRQL